MAVPVKWFTSETPGLSKLQGDTEGQLIGLLDAMLLNGFGAVVPNSITRVGTTVTVDVSGGHQFVVDQVVLLGGAVQTEYNGEHTVTSVTASAFTFEISTTPASPATGTFSAKVAPIGGWEKRFSATNKAVYRSTDVDSTQVNIRIDETIVGAGFARVTAVQSWLDMTDVDTGVGEASPLLYISKSNTENNTLRDWFLVGDSKGFYLGIDPYWAEGSYNHALYYFGDVNSYDNTDSYHFLTVAKVGNQAVTYNYGLTYGTQLDALTTQSANKFLARPWHQTGSYKAALTTAMGGLDTGAMHIGAYGYQYPNPVDGGVYLNRVIVGEYDGSNTAIRGEMPGLSFAAHKDNTGLANGLIQDGSGIYIGNRLIHFRSAITTNVTTYGSIFFNLTEDWRQ